MKKNDVLKASMASSKTSWNIWSVWSVLWHSLSTIEVQSVLQTYFTATKYWDHFNWIEVMHSQLLAFHVTKLLKSFRSSISKSWLPEQSRNHSLASHPALPHTMCLTTDYAYLCNINLRIKMTGRNGKERVSNQHVTTCSSSGKLEKGPPIMNSYDYDRLETQS